MGLWQQISKELKKILPSTESSESIVDADVLVPVDPETTIGPKTSTHKPSTAKDRASLTRGLSRYGPWGYLMLGMLLCGGALLLCGLWGKLNHELLAHYTYTHRIILLEYFTWFQNAVVGRKNQKRPKTAIQSSQHSPLAQSLLQTHPRPNHQTTTKSIRLHRTQLCFPTKSQKPLRPLHPVNATQRTEPPRHPAQCPRQLPLLWPRRQPSQRPLRPFHHRRIRQIDWITTLTLYRSPSLSLEHHRNTASSEQASI